MFAGSPRGKSFTTYAGDRDRVFALAFVSRTSHARRTDQFSIRWASLGRTFEQRPRTVYGGELIASSRRDFPGFGHPDRPFNRLANFRSGLTEARDRRHSLVADELTST